MDKTQRKTLPKHLIAGNPGNSGGKRGRSGRRPEAFTHLLARLRESPELAASLEQAIADPSSRGFQSALKVLTDYDLEKPAEKRELSGKVEVAVVFTRETRKRTSG